MKDDIVADLRARAKPWARGNRFEDFPVGRRIRHARGATMDALENAYLSKAVMNTAQ